jgi:hypothetical protein
VTQALSLLLRPRNLCYIVIIIITIIITMYIHITLLNALRAVKCAQGFFRGYYMIIITIKKSIYLSFYYI